MHCDVLLPVGADMSREQGFEYSNEYFENIRATERTHGVK
jgi:hypothetical protein